MSIELEGRLLRTLIDTGAARTHMDVQLWMIIYGKTHLPYCQSLPKLQGISGYPIRTVGKVYIRLHGTIVPVCLVETKDPTLFILGYDALRLLQAKVDTKDHRVWIHDTCYEPSSPQCPVQDITWEQHWEKEFPQVFGPTTTIGCNPRVCMKLRLKDDTPFRRAPYRIPLHKWREVEEQIEELTSKGIIRPSHSPWASPITLVPKKDGGTRMCVDYRQLNSQTLMDTYPLPRIQDILDQLSGSIIYSLIDLQSAYHQIPMDEASIPLTAFVTHKGLYEYTRMPFGLKTAPAIFQRCMNDVLHPLHGTCVLPYLDDICVFSSDATAHENDVRAVLKLLSDAGFTAKASKCHFNMDEMDLLGFTINKDGIKPQEKKVSAISGMVAPRDVKSLRRFLGMVGFHRAMIPDYSKHSSILTDLTRKKVRWQWDESHQEAFEYLRDILTWDGVVQYYPDLNKPFEVYTDASQVSVGAILVQRDTENRPRPIQYISSTLNSTQRRWPAMEKEAYAIVYALKTLRPYLYGAQFQIFTDHKPLKAMFVGEIRNTKVQRWAKFISEHGAPINFIKGVGGTVRD